MQEPSPMCYSVPADLPASRPQNLSDLLGDRGGHRAFDHFLHRLLHGIFRAAQLDFAIVPNGIARLRVSIERHADAAGIGKRLIGDLSNHWQVSVTAENEVGFNAFKGSRKDGIANFCRIGTDRRLVRRALGETVTPRASRLHGFPACSNNRVAPVRAISGSFRACALPIREMPVRCDSLR